MAQQSTAVYGFDMCSACRLITCLSCQSVTINSTAKDEGFAGCHDQNVHGFPSNMQCLPAHLCAARLIEESGRARQQRLGESRAASFSACSPDSYDGSGCVIWQLVEPLLRRPSVLRVRHFCLQMGTVSGMNCFNLGFGQALKTLVPLA